MLESENNESLLFEKLIFAFNLPLSYKEYNSTFFSEDEAQILETLWLKKAKPTNKTYHKFLQELKADLFQAIKDCFQLQGGQLVRKFLNQLYLYTSNEEIAEKISAAFINFQSALNKKIKAEDRIKEMIYNQEIVDKNESIKVSCNPVESAHETYIVSTAEKRFYVKTFSNDFTLLGSTQGKIHPNELLAYKVLEYTRLGPKTYFLISSGSSSYGHSSIYKGNYIMTEDVAQKDSEFILDSELDDSHPAADLKATKKFAIEISVASLINDLLSLSDTFGMNTKNYGIVYNNSTGEYAIQFIDHLPNARNGLFSVIKEFPKENNQYSPRRALGEHAFQSTFSFFTTMAQKSREAVGQDSIKSSVNSYIFDSSNSHLSLPFALDKAKEEVLALIKSHKVNFIDNAAKELNSYLQRIEDNIEVYKQTAYGLVAHRR